MFFFVLSNLTFYCFDLNLELNFFGQWSAHQPKVVCFNLFFIYGFVAVLFLFFLNHRQTVSFAAIFCATCVLDLLLMILINIYANLFLVLELAFLCFCFLCSCFERANSYHQTVGKIWNLMTIEVLFLFWTQMWFRWLSLIGKKIVKR